MTKDKVLQKLIDKYDSEINFNDHVSNSKSLEAIVVGYQTGYTEGYRDCSLNEKPKYILAIFTKDKLKKMK